MAMTRSRSPRDDPALRDFDDELARCTLYTPAPPIACGRAYVRVSRLTGWFSSHGPREGGGSTIQAQRLLDYAYRQWYGYPRTDPMPTSKLLDPNMGCIVIFSILLKMDRGCLVHLFRSQLKSDHNLPMQRGELVHLFYTMLEPAGEHGMYLDPTTLANEFDDLQWQFCPAKFELREEPIFDCKKIIPIIEKSKLSDSGGTATLWQIAVLEEFVTDNLKAVVGKSRYCEPKDGHGYRFNFALKTFKEGHKISYRNEVEAFHSIPPQGMIQYLGGYIQRSSQRDEASQSGLYIAGYPQETYNILLEFGDCDLETVFNTEMVPLVLEGEIDRFWSNLIAVAETLSQIHLLKHETDGMRREYWGWHADIKPSNIIEIDGQFKLADPGFAIFKAKPDASENTMPTAELAGGTSTFSAPEQTSGAGSHEYYQTIDVWALGCVFSIAATWVASGHQGVRQYAHLREVASRRVMSQHQQRMSMQESPQIGYGDYFHDGRDVLPEVINWHIYLRNILRGTDRVTAQVLDIVDQHMFIQDPRHRWQSSDVYEKLRKISLNPDGKTSTVPQDIADFLSTMEEDVLGGLEATSDSIGPPLKQDHMAIPRWKDKKSKYFRTPIPKGQDFSVTSSRPAVNSNHIPPPETPGSANSKITSRLFFDSPIQSASFPPLDMYHPSESPSGKHSSKAVTAKPHAHDKFQGKVQDIFQANEEIEGLSKWNKIKAMGKKPVDEYLAKHYQNRDIQFLVDNSWSMFEHWAHARFVLRTLATKAKGLDPNGVDLYFTLGGVKAENKTGVKHLVDAMFNPRATPPAQNDGSDTDMATRLKDLFDEHLTRVKQSRKAGSERTTKLTIIVLTNGNWNADQVAKRIVEFATALRAVTKKDIDDRPVSIEFIQFGSDAGATEKLNWLDDKLKYKGIPDLVDTEHSDGNVYKMLLGSFVPAFDDQEPESKNEDDTAAIRPTSSSTEKYYERSQHNMVSTYGPPPSMAAYTQASAPYSAGSSREPNRLENDNPHRGFSQHTTNPRRTTRDDQRRNTGTSFQTQAPHHQPSGSRDFSYHP